MTSQHLTSEACEAFVRGELAGQALVALEAHVAACVPCAQALTREARLEESLYVVARADAGAPGERHRPAAAARGGGRGGVGAGGGAGPGGVAPAFAGRRAGPPRGAL